LSSYADAVHVSPAHLNENVKRVSGVSAGRHIRQRIVLEAKYNARTTALTMKEVAFKLGFTDSAHFSKFFKKNSGVNFSDFMKVSPPGTCPFSSTPERIHEATYTEKMPVNTHA
jgi:AraC-like DNA-binding protein